MKLAEGQTLISCEPKDPLKGLKREHRRRQKGEKKENVVIFPLKQLQLCYLKTELPPKSKRRLRYKEPGGASIAPLLFWSELRRSDTSAPRQTPAVSPFAFPGSGVP